MAFTNMNLDATTWSTEWRFIFVFFPSIANSVIIYLYIDKNNYYISKFQLRRILEDIYIFSNQKEIINIKPELFSIDEINKSNSISMEDKIDKLIKTLK